MDPERPVIREHTTPRELFPDVWLEKPKRGSKWTGIVLGGCIWLLIALLLSSRW